METQPSLIEPIPLERFQVLSKEDLIAYIHGMQDILKQLARKNSRLETEAAKERELSLFASEQLLAIRDAIYGKSSEKMAAPETSVGSDIEGVTPEYDKEKQLGSGTPKPKKKRILLPSERYPNAPLVEREVELGHLPDCAGCGSTMKDSGMTEDVEYLEKIPASFRVIREKKHKYNCSSCHGDIQTAPAIPRIKPGSAFSDETIIDVGVSKFCDLIPIERQAKMAERLGLVGLPPQSLIETTHYLAAFLRPVYDKLKTETLSSRVLYADETPHRQLEGSPKSNWYFWGFSGKESAYFEAHDTRSGDVSIEFLRQSSCRYLMSDVYSGYVKTARTINEDRKRENKPLLKKIYCNAHARRKFKEAKTFKIESDFFLLRYQRIYHLEELARGGPLEGIKTNREKMRPIFEEMKEEALRLLCDFPSKSSIARAFQYFLKNFEELTLFTRSGIAPIDNNHQERLLRNPVIGRKTWYGTHSVRGSNTTAVLFSVMESCKLNNVNPRTYLAALTRMIHQKKEPVTPAEFKKL